LHGGAKFVLSPGPGLAVVAARLMAVSPCTGIYPIGRGSVMHFAHR